MVNYLTMKSTTKRFGSYSKAYWSDDNSIYITRQFVSDLKDRNMSYFLF